MQKVETSKLLARIALYDGREVDQMVVEAWHELIECLDFDEALRAVKAHYRRSRFRVMPAEIFDQVGAIRAAEHKVAADALAFRHRAELIERLGEEYHDATTPALQAALWEHDGAPEEVEAVRGVIRRQRARVPAAGRSTGRRRGPSVPPPSDRPRRLDLQERSAARGD